MNRFSQTEYSARWIIQYSDKSNMPNAKYILNILHIPKWHHTGKKRESAMTMKIFYFSGQAWNFTAFALHCKSINKKTRRISYSDNHISWFEGTNLMRPPNSRNFRGLCPLLSFITASQNKFLHISHWLVQHLSWHNADCSQKTNCSHAP